MKSVVVFSVLLVAALAAPQVAIDHSKAAQITRYESDNIGVDGYKFGYESSDGISRQEEAVLENAGTDAEALVVRGSFRWIAPDGVEYIVNFIADKNGFQPQADHLPRA